MTFRYTDDGWKRIEGKSLGKADKLDRAELEFVAGATLANHERIWRIAGRPPLSSVWRKLLQWNARFNR